MLNSCELTCVRAKPTQSSIKQSSPLLQTGLDSPSIRSRSRTKQKQSSDSCVCTNTNQKRWLSGPPGARTTHGWWEVQDPFSAFGTVRAIPVDEASNEEFWLRWTVPNSQCLWCVWGERVPHCLHRRGAALELVQSTLNAARAVRSPGELRLLTSLQPRIPKHFFGSDWYLPLMPCLLNKLTSFPNLPLLWSKDCLLKGQKLSCFSACVTWTWGEFKWLIMWLFQSFFTYHFFLFYFDLKGSALTFQSH